MANKELAQMLQKHILIESEATEVFWNVISVSNYLVDIIEKKLLHKLETIGKEDDFSS